MPDSLTIRLSKLALAFLASGVLLVGEVYADACTYGEAVMALKQGNAVRGLALMRMASRDGDRRAERYLRSQDAVAILPAIAPTELSLKTASIPRD